MKRTYLHFIAILLISFSTLGWALQTKSHSVLVPLKLTPAPVMVKVSVANSNWVETISICNTSGVTIPLTNLEFDFNYAVSMPTNIWGNPWAAWSVQSQSGTAVVLVGGTPWTPSLPPDPNCTNPLTIQFNASPSSPAPTGPFVFKAEGGQPTNFGMLTITVPPPPANNLSIPNVSVVGPNFTQNQQVNWGSAWQLKNLTPGSYFISSSPVDNGTTFYAAKDLTVTVNGQQTTNADITYQPVASGQVAITLVNAPNSTVPVTFTGSAYTISKTVSNGTSLSLPNATYNVSSTIAGYTTAITPNPITVPTNTTLKLTYTKVQASGGPYTTNAGQIVDSSNNPVTFQGVSWFGFNTGTHLLNGLWQADFTTMLNQIKACGFNAVRIPFQFDFILDTTIKPSGITTSCGSGPCNTDIPQDSALHAFQYIVKKFTDNGIYVLLDDHYEDSTYVNNQSQWISGWQKVAQMFASNPMVGYDLYNEPDSHNVTWETNSGGTPWTSAILAAANAIYTIDTQKLIFIEGTAQGALFSNWGDGFATDDATVSQGISNPKNLFTQLASKPYVNQIVVSPHMYGPDGTNNQGPDHSDQTRAYADWSRLHGYLLNNFLNINNTSKSGFCIASNCHLYPIAVGEFGGRFDPADPYYTKDVATNINIATYMGKLSNGKPAPVSWFYWDWNPNSGNTGGILKDDWATIDCNKINYLKQYLALRPAASVCP